MNSTIGLAIGAVLTGAALAFLAVQVFVWWFTS